MTNRKRIARLEKQLATDDKLLEWQGKLLEEQIHSNADLAHRNTLLKLGIRVYRQALSCHNPPLKGCGVCEWEQLAREEGVM